MPFSISSMGKVINIAHRGYTRIHLENTLEAFQAALDLGVDGVEFDVQETADGEFVIHHDDDIRGVPVGELKLSQVRRLRLKDNYRTPTLQETLQLLGGKVILLVELKRVRSVEKLIGMLQASSDMGKTAIVSFSRALIERVGELAPDIMRAVIGGQSGDSGRRATARFVSFSCAEVSAMAVEKAHSERSMVFVWDCPDEAGVRRALGFNIDGIISDYPDTVKAMNG